MSKNDQPKAQRDLLVRIDNLSRQSEKLLAKRQIAIDEAAQAKLRENWTAHDSATRRARILLAQSINLYRQASELTTQVRDLDVTK